LSSNFAIFQEYFSELIADLGIKMYDTILPNDSTICKIYIAFRYGSFLDVTDCASCDLLHEDEI
jgi:hypothetical protein